jgi:hypothetical protein
MQSPIFVLLEVIKNQAEYQSNNWHMFYKKAEK